MPKNCLLVVSYPFKMIKNSRDKKAQNKRVEREQKEFKEYLDKAEGSVEDLFQKIKNIVFANDLFPREIVIYPKHLEILNGNSVKKKLIYGDYFSGEIYCYDTYWCSDGTEAPYKVNQMLLLAQKFNTFSKDLYYIDEVTEESVSEVSEDITMHYYIQKSVELTKKL